MEIAEIKKFVEYSKDELWKVMEQTDYVYMKSLAIKILEKQMDGARIHFTGIGKPSYVAGYMASLFSSTGSPSYVLDGTEAIHGSLGQIIDGDIVIAISNSGETEELKKALMALSRISCYKIGVSGNKKSWLAEATDDFLYAHVDHEGDKLNKPPRISIQAEIFILQCLSIMLQELHQLSEEDYFVRHPGGSLGEQLKQKL